MCGLPSGAFDQRYLHLNTVPADRRRQGGAGSGPGKPEQVVIDD
jgi:hypothetical protein